MHHQILPLKTDLKDTGTLSGHIQGEFLTQVITLREVCQAKT